MSKVIVRFCTSGGNEPTEAAKRGRGMACDTWDFQKAINAVSFSQNRGKRPVRFNALLRRMPR